jgi:cytidylate kinase
MPQRGMCRMESNIVVSSRLSLFVKRHELERNKIMVAANTYIRVFFSHDLGR